MPHLVHLPLLYSFQYDVPSTSPALVKCNTVQYAMVLDEFMGSQDVLAKDMWLA